jgi:alanine dehydrogenase
MLQIDFEAVHRLAGVENLVEPLRRAFSLPAISPERMHYDLPAQEAPRTLLVMPSWQPAGAIGVKIVTVFPDNTARGLPSVNAAYLLLSGQDGQPRALIDGRALTLLRTAAVSALAADLLAPATPEVLLMVGTGALSRYLIEGHLAVRRYRSVLVWGRDAHKAASVVRDLRTRGWPVTVAETLDAAARTADVISCATLAEQPLIEGAWIKDSAHLDLVGSFKPTMREADDDCWRAAFAAVDSAAALKESGDLIGPVSRGVVNPARISLLGDLAAGRGAERVESRSIFKSVGVAHADLAVAEFLVERSAQPSG